MKLRPAVKKWIMTNHDVCFTQASIGTKNLDFSPEDFEQMGELFARMLALDGVDEESEGAIDGDS